MELKTGDILLFSESPKHCCMNCFDWLIKTCTCSRYSHSALVIVDPAWCPALKGTFVWESTWHGKPDPQDDDTKFGVQLTPLTHYTQQYPGSVRIWVRRAPCEIATEDEWIRIHDAVYNHKYDTRPYDWISAALCRRIQRQDDTFTCSAFVSYVLTRTNVLRADTCWTTVSAAELSAHRDSSLVTFLNPYGTDEYVGRFPNEDSELITIDGVNV